MSVENVRQNFYYGKIPLLLNMFESLKKDATKYKYSKINHFIGTLCAANVLYFSYVHHFEKLISLQFPFPRIHFYLKHFRNHCYDTIFAPFYVSQMYITVSLIPFLFDIDHQLRKQHCFAVQTLYLKKIFMMRFTYFLYRILLYFLKV